MSILQPSVVFLGHRIDADRIHPLQAPAPTNIQELRSFLGIIDYYEKFIPNAATILAPLNQLLCKDAKWNWSTACQQSFDKAKETLALNDVLMHYTPSLPIKMAGDALAYGIGVFISHVLPDRSERSVAFVSCSPSSSERN